MSVKLSISHGEVILIRHGETAWSRSGQHTGLTDIALTEQGSEAARALTPLLAGFDFSLVLSSPLQRATATCQLAGLGDSMRLEPDLVEWNYGDYEGMTSKQIEELSPAGWCSTMAVRGVRAQTR
jgi:broad specificity phosphatase PhoE